MVLVARKLNSGALPEVLAINLFPANPTPSKDTSGRRRYPTRDTIELMVVTDNRLNSFRSGIKEVELTHQAAMALCKLAAQRIITSEGWVHSDQLCVIRAGDEGTKLIHRISKSIEDETGAHLKIENNQAKCYRLALEADAISFTVSNLAAVDDAQVAALIRTVMMKKPDAVNGEPISHLPGGAPMEGK